MLKLITVGFTPYLPTPAGVSFTVPVKAITTWQQVMVAVDDRLHSLVEQGQLSHEQRVEARRDLGCMAPRQFGWLTVDETAFVLFQLDRPNALRWRDAVAAQQGACNPVALVNALGRALKEVEAEGGSHPEMAEDLAVQAIAHQLAFLLRTANFDDHYADRMAAVRSKAEEAADAAKREGRP